MIETVNRLIRTSRVLVQELGREPTSEEIAKRMDMPVAKVQQVRKFAQEPVSLETPIGEEEDSHLGDFIEDRQAVSPAEAVITLNLKEQTENVLRTLTPREETVIKMRFGVGDGSEHTLEEIAKPFAVSREWIRQIEAKALRKLRHSSRSRRLRAFVDGASVLSRVMHAGERESYAADDEIVLNIGDAGAFAFMINQQDGRSLGASGEIVTVRITLQNYRSFVVP